MPVTERLMKLGVWDIGLNTDTPKWVRDILQPFGHIVIYEARVDPRVMADADLLANALYVGPLRAKPTPYHLSGAGMALWLGDDEDKGPLSTSGPATQTFVQWITSILGAPAVPPVSTGSVTAVGVGTLTQTFTQVTQRTAMDFICQYFSGLGLGTAEYRCNNNGSLDAGLSTALFKTTPTEIVLPNEGGREVGTLSGIEPSQFDATLDATSYTTHVYLVGGAGSGVADISPATSYKDIHGNPVVLMRAISSPQTAAGQEVAVATAQLALYPVRNEITLRTNRYDIPHDVRCGDWLYVYDPEHDLEDLTNPQQYRGKIVHPTKLRVFSETWPIEDGMAVYFRDSAGLYTDITNWVAFEPPGTSFEVGAPIRPLLPSASTKRTLVI